MGGREPGWYEKEVRKIIEGGNKFVETSQLIKDATRSSVIDEIRAYKKRKEKNKELIDEEAWGNYYNRITGKD